MKATTKKSEATAPQSDVTTATKAPTKKSKATVVQSDVTTATAAPVTLNAVTIMDVTPAVNLPEVMVVCKKSSSGAMSYHNANICDVIRPAELLLASGVKVNLCYNLMSGRISPAIKAAHERGELTALLGDKDKEGNPRIGIDKSDLTALKKLLAYTPAQIVTAWTAHCEKAKRVTKPSLQGMIMAFTVKMENEATKLTLKEALKKWAIANMSVLDGNVGLSDIFNDYKIIGE